MKKILWITDDFKDHEEVYKENWADIGELLIIEKFEYLPDFDYVIVDYGFLGNLDNVNILRKYHRNNIPIIWSGGFGGSGRYIEDCKKIFPDEKWLHKIKSIGLGDLQWYVGNNL